MVFLEFFPVTSLKWLLVVSFICSSLALQSPNQSCHPNDLSALKEFAGNLTNGSLISAWSGEPNCCRWDGVVCEDIGLVGPSRLVSLNLSGKGLEGVVSQSLGNLVHLKLLDLSYNSLHGKWPHDLSNLQQLETLNLSHNMLAGAVWQSIAKLKAIQSLDLSSNFFTGNFTEFGQIPNLVELNVSNNSFSGGFSNQFCSLSRNIQVLDMSMNKFTGGLKGLDNCVSTSLRQLHLDENSFSGLLPESMYLMTQLKQLSVSSNDFSGRLSDRFSKLSNLKSLVLYGNRFSGPLPNVFGNLTQLEQLVAHSNSFSGLLPPSLAYCYKLRVLDLRNNSFSGVIDLDFTELPYLSILDLANNHFRGPLPQSLSSRELKVLSLAKNEFTGQVPESYANLTSLTFLSFSNNSLVNLSQAFSVLQSCTNLATLFLNKNFRGEEIPRNVNGFPSLMILALGNCGLNGHIPSWLLNCSKLQVLDLSWNHLDGSIPPWIGKMDNLFYLDFSNNSLTGEIPENLTQLRALFSEKNSLSSRFKTTTAVPLFVQRSHSSTGLQYNQASSFPPSIFLSNNRLNGSLRRPEFGRLRRLHVLDLSRNNITGTIPSSISDMVNLEVLDLSYNNLYGSIPSSFIKLTFLSKFSVANNHLSGAIPTGGQFHSFPSSSFEGNSELRDYRSSNSTQPFTLNEEGGQHFEGLTWQSLFTGYCFGVILGVLAACLMFSTGKPKLLNKFVKLPGRKMRRKKQKEIRWLL